jgi:hypothetical protein
MNPIFITTIPHKDHRYDTVGDYYFQGDELQLEVSDMENEDYEFLVAYHELLEWKLIRHAKIPIAKIDAFDMAYEKARKKRTKAPCGCKPTKYSEPGNDIHAPYHKQHMQAAGIEYVISDMLGVNWKEYGKKVCQL